MAAFAGEGNNKGYTPPLCQSLRLMKRSLTLDGGNGKWTEVEIDCCYEIKSPFKSQNGFLHPAPPTFWKMPAFPASPVATPVHLPDSISSSDFCATSGLAPPPRRIEGSRSHSARPLPLLRRRGADGEPSFPESCALISTLYSEAL